MLRRFTSAPATSGCETLLFALLLGACGRNPAPVAAPSSALLGDTVCVILAGPATPSQTVTVALTEPVDPVHAPVPRTDAERLVFGQLYETLIRLDCEGRPVPGLAKSWASADSGRRWTFTLRDGARFWDGVPVTARDVLASWMRHDSAKAVTMASEREISVRFDERWPTDPREFAAPALAVSKRAPDNGWPIGTGAFWVTNESASARLIKASPLEGHHLPTVDFRVFSDTDARDVLDAGADLLVTSDAAVLDYARTRPELLSIPLAWDRTYVLLAPAAVSSDGLDRRDLERAVHVEARAPEFTCAEPAFADTAASRPAPAARRIVYDRTDRTARDLAERLVARAELGPGTVAAGFAPDAFAAALEAGNEWAYIYVLQPRPFGDPCETVKALPARRVLQRLVETRSFAIVRRGLPRLTVDWGGIVRFAPR